jgi:hypothetical protein
MGQGGELEPEVEEGGGELMEPPNFDFDHGRESPYRYVHGAPLHNVVEEEEEEWGKGNGSAKRASHHLLAKEADSRSRSSAPRLRLLNELDGSSQWTSVLAIHDLCISFSFMPLFFFNNLIPASAHTRSTRTM